MNDYWARALLTVIACAMGAIIKSALNDYHGQTEAAWRISKVLGIFGLPSWNDQSSKETVVAGLRKAAHSQ